MVSSITLGKVDIVHQLATARGYRRFLEISTPVTGHMFRTMNASMFEACHRLSYRCPIEWSDGAAIELRSGTSDISECLSEIRRRGTSYDVMLVDGFHVYDDAVRDLREAVALLAPGGAMVVHDVLPASWEIASPSSHMGEWSGSTFEAFLDVVLCNDAIEYYTLDTDYGCAVATKTHREISDAERQRAVEWNAATAKGRRAAFDMYVENKIVLLRVR